MVFHYSSEREAVLDDVKPIHTVCRGFHSSARGERVHRFEVAMAAIEKIAIQRENYVCAIQFRNKPRAGSERALRSSCLLMTQQRFINAPAHARKHFFEFIAQSFTRWGIRFPNQECKTVSTLARKRVAKISYVSGKIRAVTCFYLVNEITSE